MIPGFHVSKASTQTGMALSTETDFIHPEAYLSHLERFFLCGSIDFLVLSERRQRFIRIAADLQQYSERAAFLLIKSQRHYGTIRCCLIIRAQSYVVNNGYRMLAQF